MKTKQNFIFLNFLFLSFFIVSCQQNEPINKNWTLSQQLASLKNVKISTEKGNDFYPQAYKLLVKQPINHNDTSEGYFWQKVYLSHKDFSRPMALITAGYTANYNYITEIADLIQANQIIVEHRYFGESKPDSLIWKDLNLEQATADLHHIRQIFGKIYKNKWLSSGISKGGQTTIAYRYFYPNDVAASVPYVAPLTFEKEDSRIPPFITNTAGDAKSRKKIKDFQLMLLKNKKKLMPAFEKLAKSKDWTFNAVGGTESGFEHGVLEFSFVMWQWGNNIDKIPKKIEPIDSLMNFLAYTDPFSFFCDKGIEDLRPYFYQALNQMGIYTYDTKDFKNLLDYAQNPSFDFTMEGKIPINYSNTLNIKIDKWLKTNGNNFIYIYGANDPWFATAVTPDTLNTNSFRLVKQGGSHKTRIKSFSKKTQKQVKDSLSKWLNTKIE